MCKEVCNICQWNGIMSSATSLQQEHAPSNIQRCMTRSIFNIHYFCVVAVLLLQSSDRIILMFFKFFTICETAIYGVHCTMLDIKRWIVVLNHFCNGKCS